MDLHKLKVEIIGESKKFQQACNGAIKEAKATTNAVNKELGKIGDSKTGQKLSKQMSMIKEQANAMRRITNQAKESAGLAKATKEYKDVQGEIKKSTTALQKLKSKQDELGDGGKVPTASYEALQKKIANVENELDELITKQQKWASLGGNVTNSSAFRNTEKQIEDAHKQLQQYRKDQGEMESSGKAFAPSEKWKALQGQIATAKNSLMQYKQQEGSLLSSGKAYTPTAKASPMRNIKASASGVRTAIGNQIRGIANGSIEAGNASRRAAIIASKSWGILNTALIKPIGGLSRLGKGFLSVVGKLKGLTSALHKNKSAMSGSAYGTNMLSRAWKTFAMTAKFMLASMLFMGAMNGMKEGFKSLAQYSDRTNDSLSMLKSALIQLRNALSTAFAPILNVIAPALSSFIGWISSALNAIGQLFAALTGQKTVVIAKKVNSDFAGGLDDTGASADDATDKVEKYKKSLMGFDQINKLDDPMKDSSGSGGGDSAGGLSPGDMFETVEVENQWANWADKIKDVWAKADFTEIGEILGNKLNAALESIDWAKIKETSAKIAKSIATFLNGFIGGTNWTLVGGTLAEGINTVIEFAYTFVTTFNWKKFGTAIGDAINGFFAKLDLAKAGQALSKGIEGILDTGISFVTTVNWSQIGSKIAEFICNIDWIKVGKKIITLLGEAIVGAANLLSGFVDKLGEKLVEYIDSGKFWEDLFGLVKLTLEITAKIAGAAWSLLCKIIDKGVDILVNLVQSGVAWLWALISGKDYETAKKEVEIGFKLPDNKVVDFVKAVIEFMAMPTYMKKQVFIELVRDGWRSIGEWVGDKVDVLVNRIKNWKISFNEWVRAKADILMERKKDWKKTFNSWVRAKADILMERKKNWKKTFNSWVRAKASILFGREKGWSGSFIKWVLGGIDYLKLKFKLPKIGVNWGSKSVLGFKISYPNGFYTYAKGGFPEEGPFMMNRGEIAGKFSNGKSVVANNQQITDGISSAVYNAFVRAGGNSSGGISSTQFETAILRIISTLSQLGFYIDSEKIAEAATKGQAKRDRRFNPVTIT